MARRQIGIYHMHMEGKNLDEFTDNGGSNYSDDGRLLGKGGGT